MRKYVFILRYRYRKTCNSDTRYSILDGLKDGFVSSEMVVRGLGIGTG